MADTAEERARDIEEHDYWAAFGNARGWPLYGWTGREKATFKGPDGEWIAVSATVAASIEEAERAAFLRGIEEAAKALCPWCNAGWALVGCVHLNPGMGRSVRCKASKVRALTPPATEG